MLAVAALDACNPWALQEDTHAVLAAAGVGGSLGALLAWECDAAGRAEQAERLEVSPSELHWGMRCAAGVLAVQDDPGSTVELSELLARRALMMAAECADAVAKSEVRHGVKLNTSGGRCVPLDLIFAWCAQ